MTWRAINYGTAENDEGVQVKRTGFRALTYIHSGRELTIDVEVGDNDLGVYALSIDQWDGSGDVIGDQERESILNDVMGALRTLRVPFKVLWN